MVELRRDVEEYSRMERLEQDLVVISCSEGVFVYQSAVVTSLLLLCVVGKFG